MSEPWRSQRERIGEDAVREATGKTWTQWLNALDRAGAASLDRQGIVTVLSDRFDVGRWWSQMIAVSFEQERGLREVNEKSDGFSVSVSRAISVPVERAYEAWATPEARSGWLAQPRVQIRKATENKSLRMTWWDGLSTVEVSFYKKGNGGKAQVTVQHYRLRSAEEVEQKREFWAARLGRLKAILEHG